MRRRETTSGARREDKALRVGLVCALVAVLLASGCLPQGTTVSGGRNITVYGFSILKEVLEKEVFPAFSAKWKREHNEEVHFTSSFAGSETVTNQIIAGVDADIAILSIERDVTRMEQAGAVTSDWRSLPARGIVNKTPFIIIVRKGNPKGIRDFADLGKEGVELIHPDPVSSGGAQWSVLAVYGSELIKSEKQTGTRDEARALKTLQTVWKNILTTPDSARAARTQFELGHGDALITYELEGLLMKQAGAEIEIVVPESTIFSEHPAVVIDRKVTDDERPVVTAFLQYLWTEEAQRAFVKYHFRSANNEQLNAANTEFAQIKLPFTVNDLGGWNKAYPEIIERVWRDQVQKNR